MLVNENKEADKKTEEQKNQVLKNGLRTYLVPLTPITFLNS
jgi:hypothetical protein